MARREIERTVKYPPMFSRFKPIGVPARKLDNCTLSLDEFEALRLADYMQLEQLEASRRMGISRPTFTRIIERARKKFVSFIIEGKQLIVEGGNVHFRGNIIRCEDCKYVFNVDIGKDVKTCPSCDSENLLDLAEEFGHGRCCEEYYDDSKS